MKKIKEDIYNLVMEVTTKVVHPGVLEVPEGKNFWEMPISHYKTLQKKKGAGAIMKALLNLERWNSKKDPPLAAKARKIIDAIKEK